MNKNVLYTQDSPIPIYSMVTWTEVITSETRPFRKIIQHVGRLVDVYGQTAQVRNTETGESTFMNVNLLRMCNSDGIEIEQEVA